MVARVFEVAGEGLFLREDGSELLEDEEEEEVEAHYLLTRGEEVEA